MQRQDKYAFTQTTCDQAIEQTANRDSKTKGGLMGDTINKGVAYCWILSHHERAQINQMCEIMAGKDESSRKWKDLDQTQIKSDEDAVASVDHLVNDYSIHLSG